MLAAAVANSPIAGALFGGLWIIGLYIKLAIETKADSGIRAILGLTMAIKNATQQAQYDEPRRPTTVPRARRRTDPQALPRE